MPVSGYPLAVDGGQRSNDATGVGVETGSDGFLPTTQNMTDLAECCQMGDATAATPRPSNDSCPGNQPFALNTSEGGPGTIHLGLDMPSGFWSH
jgi:hypothetical protein